MRINKVDGKIALHIFESFAKKVGVDDDGNAVVERPVVTLRQPDGTRRTAFVTSVELCVIDGNLYGNIRVELCEIVSIATIDINQI